MNYEQGNDCQFSVPRSKFSCSLAAALLNGLFEHPASRSCAIAIRKITVDFQRKLSFSTAC